MYYIRSTYTHTTSILAIEWYKLAECESVNYSGVILSSSNQNDHIKNRISACRKAFYGFQGAGFSSGYIDSNVIVYVWNSAIRPVLTYGINCVHLSKSSLSDAEKIQSNYLRQRWAFINIVKAPLFCRQLGL